MIYVIATACMVFDDAHGSDTLWPATLWWIGGLMVCVGGYWFWFFIRADVARRGNSPLRIMRADLFVLSLLASVTLGLDLGLACKASERRGSTCSSACTSSPTTLLFGSVPWSKFAHMFFKPAAAFEKRVSYANGTRSNLPAPSDKPEQFGSAANSPALLISIIHWETGPPCQPSFT